MDDEALHGSMAGACKIFGLRFLAPCPAACARISRKPGNKVVPGVIRLLRFILIDRSNSCWLSIAFLSLCSFGLLVNSLRSLSFKTSWT